MGAWDLREWRWLVVVTSATLFIVSLTQILKHDPQAAFDPSASICAAIFVPLPCPSQSETLTSRFEKAV
jgi:hypothetical protein